MSGIAFISDYKETVLMLLETPESPWLRVGRSALFGLLVLLVGCRLVKVVIKVLNRAFEKAKVEAGAAKFLVSLSRFLLFAVLIVIIMKIWGLETGSLVALVASAGLTIGLALQSSLSNFAGGILILVLRPFQVGDYILALANEGTVTSIDVFYTRLLTMDDKVVVIPNGILSNSSVVNMTSEPVKLLDLSVIVDYSEDSSRIRDVLIRIAEGNERVTREVKVFIQDFGPKGFVMGLRTWVRNEDYWSLRCELLEEIKEEFDKEGIAIQS